MNFTPNYPTNLSIDVGTDLLDLNQTIKNCLEDIPLTNVLKSVESDSDQLFNFIAYGVLLNIIGVFGIIGNIITIIILSRPQMKFSINYLLIGLAGCDTVFIIISILLFGLPSIYWSNGYPFVYNNRIQPIIAAVVYPVAMISQTVSAYLTIAVTLGAFVAVCHPLRAQSLCSCGRTRLYMIAVLLFSILYNTTRFWEVSIEQCTYPNKMLVYRVQSSTLRRNIVYINVYINWMYLVFIYGLPFTVLALFNLRIYIEMRKANKERLRFTNNKIQTREIGLVAVLLRVIVGFLLVNAAALTSNILEAIRFKTIDVFVETASLVVTINSSANFIIYMIFRESFSSMFFKLFFPHKLRFSAPACAADETQDMNFISINGDFHNSTISLRQDQDILQRE